MKCFDENSLENLRDEKVEQNTDSIYSSAFTQTEKKEFIRTEQRHSKRIIVETNSFTGKLKKNIETQSNDKWC